MIASTRPVCKTRTTPFIVQTAAAMPIIDLTIARGQFDEAQQDEIAHELTQCLLRCDVTRDNPKAPAINWCYIHELPPTRIYVAGQVQNRPHYRIDITLMQGAMSDAVKSQVVHDMTEVMLKAEGQRMNPLNASRVWVTLREIDEGNWGAGGRIYGLEDLMAYLSGR